MTKLHWEKVDRELRVMLIHYRETGEPTLEAILDAVQRVIDREGEGAASDELDQARVQLAGCLVAAEGGTSEAVVAKQGDWGWSLAYQKTLDLRRAFEALRATQASDREGAAPTERQRTLISRFHLFSLIHDESMSLSQRGDRIWDALLAASAPRTAQVSGQTGEAVCRVCGKSFPHPAPGTGGTWTCSDACRMGHEPDKQPREPGCQCHLEIGDSPCRVHGEEADAEAAPAPPAVAVVPMGVSEDSRFNKALREARAAIHHPPSPRTELVKEGPRTYEREVPGAPPEGAAPTTQRSVCELVDCRRQDPHSHEGRCLHATPGDGSCDNCRASAFPGEGAAPMTPPGGSK